MGEVKEEEKLARLEEKVEFLIREVDEIKKDIRELRQESKLLKEEMYKLDKKFTVLTLIIIFLIIFLNQSALKFIFKVLGLLK